MESSRPKAHQFLQFAATGSMDADGCTCQREVVDSVAAPIPVGSKASAAMAIRTTASESRGPRLRRP